MVDSDDADTQLPSALAKLYNDLQGLNARYPDDVQDYAHDVVVKLLGERKRVSEWLGYVYRSAARRVWRRREPRELDPLLAAERLAVPSENLALRVDVRRAIARLPKDLWRQYIYEVYWEGRTLDEIAARRGVTRQSVYDVLQAALRALKRDLGQG